MTLAFRGCGAFIPTVTLWFSNFVAFIVKPCEIEIDFVSSSDDPVLIEGMATFGSLVCALETCKVPVP